MEDGSGQKSESILCQKESAVVEEVEEEGEEEAEGEEEDEELAWIESQFKGLVIGRQRQNLNDLKIKTGATLFIQQNSIFVHGTEGEREQVKDIIQKKIAMASTEGDEEILDYIPKNSLRLFIGKKGLLDTIYNKTGAVVSVKSRRELVMKGSPAHKKMAHAFIKNTMANNPKLQRQVFATEIDAKYLLQNVARNSNKNIYLLNPENIKDKFNFNYNNMPEFQKYLLEQIETLKENTRTKNASAHMYLHIGKVTVSTGKEEKENDRYTAADICKKIKRSRKPWICKFEGAVAAPSSDKLTGLPSFQCYVRYDISLSTPTARKFRYKVYMKENEHDIGLKLCKPDDLAISLLKFARRTGPGLLWSTPSRTCRADLLLPKKYVARFNIDTAYPDLQDGSQEIEEDKIIESFCNNLTVTSIVENDLPNLPHGFDVIYFRKCHRTEYDFHPNIVVVSREEEMVNDCSDRVSKQNELVDIRILNKEFNRILETTTWTVEEFMEFVPNYFDFIGQIFDYLDN